MPVGIIINVCMVLAGGVIGAVAGDRLSEEFKESLNCVFGACAMTMGIYSIVLMVNMPAVILSVILGTTLGMVIRLGKGIYAAGEGMQKLMGKIFKSESDAGPEYSNIMVTAIVLFCFSGTGIYGSIVSGMTGDHSILIAKSVLDLFTAVIFACTLGMTTCIIAVPQIIIFLALFFLAGVIYPICTPDMINDFKACGGVLLLATGFRMLRLKNFPVADMIPSMILVMPVSFIWSTYILPLLS